MDQTHHLMLALPATLVALGALSCGLQRLLREKGPGLAGTAALLSLGMAAGVGLMGLCQSLAS
ncbi:hypothetical protein CCR94_07875 [Rhodoblastus sphagnicola]|uniref:Uncharacterized protein n=1 Tax=Rhodoblastus sphagnicola TaxID=333368 RepID=A0A2S6NB81_9HYPH|nr:hypothetical protein [Rhodoblastus sphagnicola]MBB4197735.1 hypothetical protein [Rhodoblastus sphagnicola]PPQ31880.1 hypothetical protein CCR94_07875 [Rhodoblastus sphagnicola]